MTTKNSILCPNCRRLISKDEPVCPYCGTKKPGSWWKSNIWTGGFRNPQEFIKLIIAVNIGMYIISLLVSKRQIGVVPSPFQFLSPSTQGLVFLGATGVGPINQFHNWWSLLAANYLHGSLLHILFNMLALRQLAPLVAQEYGTYRMFVIYTLGGIIGFLISYLFGVWLTIGASASVCALIGALLYFGKSRGGAYGQAVYSQIGGWAIGIFIFGFLVPGINNWGHGGGMAAGALLGMILGYQERNKETLAHKFLAGGCAMATILVLVWAVFSAFIRSFVLSA